MKHNFLLVLTAAVVLGACNNAPKDAKEQAEQTNENKIDSSSMTNAATEIAKNDADFLVFASNVGTFEIEAAKLAAKNSKNAGVKEFALMMVKDHTAMGAEVKTLAGIKNVTLPADLSSDLKEEWTKLDSLSGKKFDKEYADANVKGHKETINKFEKASNSSDYSAEVKQLATTTLPKLREHKEHSDMLQKDIDKK